MLLVGLLAFAASSGLSPAALEKLTQGTPQKFAQSANGHAYEGQSWNRVDHLAIYMIWPKGQPNQWLSYIHDNRTNSRKLHRKSEALSSEVLDQIVKDYGIEGA